jgi:hypothetical protein
MQNCSGGELSVMPASVSNDHRSNTNVGVPWLRTAHPKLSSSSAIFRRCSRSSSSPVNVLTPFWLNHSHWPVSCFDDSGCRTPSGEQNADFVVARTGCFEGRFFDLEHFWSSLTLQCVTGLLSGGLRNDSTDAHRWAQLVYSRNAPLFGLLHSRHCDFTIDLILYQ